MNPASEQSTSDSLLESLRRGEPSAWARVAQVYGPSIEKWTLKSRRLKPNDAEEVVARVMEAVVTDLVEYRRKHPHRSLRKWLWRVTRNKLADLYRERFRFQLFDPQQAEQWLIDDGLLPDEPPDDPAQLDETVQRAMEQVRQRTIGHTWPVFLRAVRGEGTTAAIAADFGISEENVRQIKMRCLKNIRDSLELPGVGTGELPDR
ncbi:MAG: RNA polymerase sigma factor [Rubripirellula sp.]